MAQVFFYTHATLDKSDPAKNWWDRFTRWINRKVSPVYGHCGLLEGNFFHFGREGYKEEIEEQLLDPDSRFFVELNRPIYQGSNRFAALKVVLGFFFPRKFDNCAGYVGRLIGVEGVRTPDALFRALEQDYRRCVLKQRERGAGNGT
jgi:hypothetical protein